MSWSAQHALPTRSAACQDEGNILSPMDYIFDTPRTAPPMNRPAHVDGTDLFTCVLCRQSLRAGGRK